MFRNNRFQEKIILKRIDEEEKNLNYTKIYDLSILDTLPEINAEKKFSLLITIKKILLCTNKYVDICNNKEILQYCFMAFVVFFIYIVSLSPLVQIYFMTEEQSDSLQDFNVFIKFGYYSISQILEILFRIFFNYYRKRKMTKIFLYYARNELNKIKNFFSVEINENFDLTICKSIDKDNDKNNDINFFQYVICYPNIRFYDWNMNILNEKEKVICSLIKNKIQNIEDIFLLKYSFSIIIVIFLYFISFYFLTKANIKLFFVFMLTLILFTKIISIILSNDMKKNLVLNEEIVNKSYINQGYFVSFSTCVISIFKLNDKYNGMSEIDLNEVYKTLYKQFNIINDKFKSFY